MEGMWNSLNESRPTSRSELSAWYEAVLNAQESSGMSVSEAADEVGVTPSTLYQWKRRLSPAPGDLQPTAPGLVQVHVTGAPDHFGEEARSVVLRLGEDRSIEVPDGFDSSELARLIEVVVSC